jgi:hypothetical protein
MLSLRPPTLHSYEDDNMFRASRNHAREAVAGPSQRESPDRMRRRCRRSVSRTTNRVYDQLADCTAAGVGGECRRSRTDRGWQAYRWCPRRNVASAIPTWMEQPALVECP